MLACPAMGGNCCGNDAGLIDSGLLDAGLGDQVQIKSQPPDSQPCCCCTHEAPVDRGLPTVPTCPDSHDPCHSCLCGGALPAGSSAASVIRVASHYVSTRCLLSDRHSAASFDDFAGYSPPAGRVMLTLHCRLLI